jgi:phosphoribosylglycinamide formyltransferase, formyltetrahydrofolate-dependent
MRTKRIVVLVSGGGTNLKALIDALQDGKITNAEIAAVISSTPDAYALSRAKEANITGIVVDRKKYTGRNEFTTELIDVVKAQNPDCIVLAGFMCILSTEFCREFDRKIINVHPALIPSFCGDGYYGLHVHEAALAKGVKVSGATVHFVNEVTDGGPIILQKAVDVLQGDTPDSLQRRIMEQAEWQILPEAVNLFCNEKLMISEDRVYIRT